MENEINVNEETVNAVEEQETAKTYTEEQVLALIQSESDKRVSQALKTQQKKYEKQLSISKLDDEARAKAEADARIEELEAQLQAYVVEKEKAEIMSVLGSRGLNAELANYLHITDDATENQATIDSFDRIFKAAVKAEVEKRMAGSAPKAGTGVSGEITKEQFKSMPLSQQAQIAATNPDLYKKFYN